MRSNALLLIAVAVAVPVAPRAQVSQQSDSERQTALKSTALGGNVARPDLAGASQRIIASTNAFRQQENLSPLQPNAQLATAAQYFADFMTRTGKYGHSADGATPAARAKKFGYEYCIVAENIAYQFSSIGFSTDQLAQRFFEGWQKSPGHRKNMLDPNVTETAVAVSRSADTGHFYSVQLFGRPSSASIEFSIANRASTPVEYLVDEQTFPLPPRVTRTHKRCRPSTLVFQNKTIEPRSGQSFVISQQDGALQLTTK